MDWTGKRLARRAWTIGAASLVALGVTLAAAGPARAVGAWDLTYDLDPTGGMNCSMETHWADGSQFAIFSNANDFIGFYVSDPSWRLMVDQASSVTFRFGGRAFTFPVNAVSTNEVVGDLSVNEYRAMGFLERWARAYRMSIVFPSGEAWQVNLTGTMATFRQWANCHEQLERIARSRGTWGSGGGARPSANPF